MRHRDRRRRGDRQHNVAAILTTLRNDPGYNGHDRRRHLLRAGLRRPGDTGGIEPSTPLIAAAANAGAEVAAAASTPSSRRRRRPAATPIAAGLVLPNDVHPTAQGQQLLADAVVAAVNG